MKKTLLIAAAALAAGVISSQAQVYSQNVVGYINQTIPAGGYQIVGSQLVNGSDANATNGDINATLINGLISSNPPLPDQNPALSTNSVLYAWSGAGYAVYYYFNQADATAWEGFASPAGWYTAGGALASVNVANGQACFIQNVASVPMTVTTVGTVLQGTNVGTTTINPGYNLINLQVPISTNPVVAGYGLPITLTSSDASATAGVPVQTANDTLYAWSGSGYSVYYFFNAADATTWEGFAAPAGFYTAGGDPMPATAYAQVNQGFFLYHTGAPVTWNTTFSVQ